MPELVYQQLNDDYIDDLDPLYVMRLIESIMRNAADTVYGHIYFGPVASGTPMLNFAHSRETGLFVSINPASEAAATSRLLVCQHSDDFVRCVRLIWGQDDVVIPFAFFLPHDTAKSVVEYFCLTGNCLPDLRWLDFYRESSWDFYDTSRCAPK